MTVRQCIVATANYYGRQISEDVLEMYAMDLADLPSDKVIDGYNQYRRNPANRTFPLPGQIRELVNPGEFVAVEAQAREIAGRIIDAITKYGWCNGREAQVYIGPIGWQAVQAGGGWAYLCENIGPGHDKISPTTFQAQMRDRIQGQIQYGDALESKILRIESRERRKELERVDFAKLLPNNDDPGAA